MSPSPAPVPEPLPSSSSPCTDASLELTFLAVSFLNNRPSTSFSRPRYSAIAWIGPLPSKPPKPLPLLLVQSSPPQLHLPISFHDLQNPLTSITIQLLSHPLPLRRSKLVGSASVPLSGFKIGGEVVRITLRKSSGRDAGVLLVSARVMWCLTGDSVGGRGTEVPATAAADGWSGEGDGSDFAHFVEPSAPMLPEIESHGFEEAPLSLEETSAAHPVGDRRLALRSFLLGLIGGTVATAIVGLMGFSEG